MVTPKLVFVQKNNIYFQENQQKLLPPELHFLTPICTIRLSAGASPHTPLLSLQRSPQTF